MGSRNCFFRRQPPCTEKLIDATISIIPVDLARAKKKWGKSPTFHNTYLNVITELRCYAYTCGYKPQQNAVLH